METVSTFHLELDLEETGVLLCLMRLGMDAFVSDVLDLNSLLRLDRLPAEAFKNLALKLTAATEKMDIEVPLDRLGELGSPGA